MNKKYKLVVPEKGLTKAQIEEIASRGLSISWIVKNQGRGFGHEDMRFYPMFLLEEIKEPEVLAADDLIADVLGLDEHFGYADFYHVTTKNLLNLVQRAEKNERLKRESENQINPSPCDCTKKLKVGHTALGHVEIYECQQCGELSIIPF